MKPDIKIFDGPEKLGEGFAEEFVSAVNEYIQKGEHVNIALSGGNTPKLLFNALTANYKNDIDWNYVYIFWVDERCVGPDSDESNYKMTKENLLDKITIYSNNVHRIKGEEDPEVEALRCSEMVRARLPGKNGLPEFDIVLLGMGADGHTASIFPGQLELFESDLIYSESVNPVNKQKRITMTGRVINNAKKIYFLISGKDKSDVLKKIIEHDPASDSFPAAHVKPASGNLHMYIDKDAAEKL